MTTYTINVPHTSETGVVLDIFDLTKVAYLNTQDSTGAKGAATRVSNYVVIDGDRKLPTRIVVKRITRPASSGDELGSQSYALKIEGTLAAIDGDVTSYVPWDATLSWNMGGMIMSDEDAILSMLNSLFSLAIDSFATGVPQSGNLTRLAYGDTNFLD